MLPVHKFTPRLFFELVDAGAGGGCLHPDASLTGTRPRDAAYRIGLEFDVTRAFLSCHPEIDSDETLNNLDDKVRAEFHALERLLAAEIAERERLKQLYTDNKAVLDAVSGVVSACAAKGCIICGDGGSL